MADSEYTEIVQEMWGRDPDQELRQSLIEGMDANPDLAAKALPLAESKKIPLDMAERNIDQLERDRRFEQIDFSGMRGRAPALADFLRNKENARLAHDDLGFLEAMGKTLGDVPEAMAEGQMDTTLGLLRSKQMEGMATADDLELIEKLSTRQRPEQLGTGGFFSGVVTEGAKMLPLMLETSKSALAYGLTSALGAATVTAVTPAAPAAPIAGVAGFSAGATIGAFNSMRRIEAGLAFDEFLSIKDPDGNRIDPNAAMGMAQMVGIANGALELAPLGMLLKNLPYADKLAGYFTKEGVQAALKYPGVREALTQIGLNYGKLAATEGATEYAQEAVNLYAAEILKATADGEFASDLNNLGLPNEEGRERLFQAGKAGFQAALGLGFPGTAINTTRVLTEANKQPSPESVTNYLKNARQVLADPNGKLPKRSAAKTREYLDGVLQGQTFTLDGEGVQTFYQNLPDDVRARLAAAMPDFEKMLSEAITTGGDMQIPRADYFTYIQPIDESGSLDEYVRLVPEHLSKKQMEEMQGMMDDLYGAMNDMQGATDGEQVQENFYTQLLAKIGQRGGPSSNVDVARLLSQNPRAFYETMVERTGGDARAVEILDRLFKDLKINRVNQRVDSIRERTDFDLFLDKVRNREKSKRYRESKTSGKTDLLGKVTKRKREKAAPKPVLDFLQSKGGIRTGSSAAKLLKDFDITPKTYPKLFSKDGAIDGLDNISLQEAQAFLGNVLNVQGGATDSTDTDPVYVDMDWLVETIQDEALGRGALSEAELMDQQSEKQMQDLLDILDQYGGLDITQADNNQIKDVLDRYRAEMREGLDGGQTLNQGTPVKTDTPEFKAWFGDSKVVDDQGKPLVVYSGHHNLELYGDQYDPKKGTAGGFYASEDANIASNYSLGKMGVKEYYENGDQYRFKQKNGKWGKKIWQIELSAEQQKIARSFIQDVGYDLEKYWQDHQRYDKDARTALIRGGLRDLQSIWRFLEGMGENIAYASPDDPANPLPYFMRQNKNTFEELLDQLGIEWQSYNWSNPGVFPLYLSIQNPLDAEKPFPADLLSALKKKAAHERKQGTDNDQWTSNMTLKEWVGKIESGDEYWTTQIPKSAMPILKEFGYDGIKELGLKNETDRSKRQINWIAFDPGQIKSVFNRGTFDPNDARILYQGSQDPRGAISFMNDGTAIMSLFEKEDLSTVLHELGHLYWKAMTDIAQLDGIDPRIVTDVNAVRAWAGADPIAAGQAVTPLTVEQEEKIADGFLAYLREGDAPSLELKSAFARFKGWMTRLYKGVRDTLPSIDKEVKEVFDRMLATDEQIERLAREPGFSIDQTILNMLNKADAARYVKKMEHAIEDMKEKLFKKAMKESEARNSREFKEARASLVKEVTADVESGQLQRTIDAIIAAGGLNRDKLIKEFGGAEILTYMARHGRGMVAKKGEKAVDPSAMAGMAGWKSGREMIMAIMNAAPKKARINQIVDDQMYARFGDMLHNGTIEREAMEAYHSALRAEVLDMELRILAELAKMPAPSKEAIKARAMDIINTSKVKDIQPERRLRAENAAYFRYGKALGKKDYIKATQAKAQQLLNHHLYRMSLDARDQMERNLKTWRRIVKSKDANISKNIDIDYVYAVRSILVTHGIGSPADLERWGKSFSQWERQLLADNPDLHSTLAQAISMHTEGVPPWIERTNRRGIVSRTPPYMSMEWGDFQALNDAVDNLMGVGRDERTIVINGKKVEVAQAVTKIRDVLDTKSKSGMATGYGGKISDADKRAFKLYGVAAWLRRVPLWVRDMDQGNTGIFHDVFWNPVKDGINAYRDERKVYMKKMLELVGPVKNELHGDPIEAPELISTVTGERYVFEDKGELLGMIMHMGNDSNYYKLLKGMGWVREDADGNMDDSAFRAFISRMEQEGVLTKADYDLRQNLWNLMAEVKPAVWRAHKEMYGFRPEEVTATPLQTPFGEYPGGYWPAIVDKTKSEDAAIRADKNVLQSDNNATAFPTTGRGATKSRVDAYAAPLEFSLRLLPSHLDWALRFVHIEPAIKNVAKVAMNKDFRAAMREVDPAVVTEMIIPWLQTVGRQSTDVRKPGQGWQAANDVAHFVRVNAAMQFMMGNFSNAFQQVTGITPIMMKVGKRNFARNLLKFMASPKKAHRNVNEMSATMRNSSTIFQENAQQAVSRILAKRSTFKKVQDFQGDYAYFMQSGMQSFVNTIGWMAAFDQASAGKVRDISPDNIQDCVRYADSVVSDTQGLNDPEYVSRVEVQAPMVKLFLMFYSFFNNYGNFLVTEAKAVAKSDRSIGGKSMAALNLYLMGYAIPVFMADFIAMALRGDVPDDDDDDGSALDEWFAAFMISQVKFAAATVPWVGQAINTAVGQFTDSPFDDQISASPALSALSKAIKAPFSVYRAIFEDGDASKAVGDTMSSLGFAGLPAVAVVRRPVTYAVDVAEGDSEPDGALEVGRGIVAGPASTSGKN